MKKIILGLSTFFTIIVFSMFIFEKPMFLGAEIITIRQFEEKIKSSNSTNDVLSDKVFFEQAPLVFDSISGDYFITVSEAFRGIFSTDNSTQLYWLKDDNNDNTYDDYSKVIENDGEFSLGIIHDNQFEIVDIKISTLPFIHIKADFVPTAKYEDIPYIDGLITIIDPINSKNNRYTVDTYNMLYRAKGETSLRLWKHPYKFQLLTDNYERQATSLFGLRNDDDWYLQAVAGDKTRIREAVTLDLFMDIIDTAQTKHANPQEFAFCELFINNEYYGIYQLTEPMDSRQANLNEKTDYLYKTDSWYFPPFEKVESHQNTGTPEYIGVFSKFYPEYKFEHRFNPFIEYASVVTYGNMAQKEITLESISKVENIENIIDNSIAILVLALADNDPKNTYFAAKQQDDGSYIFFKELYDFNYSLGDTYSESTSLLTTPMTSPYLSINSTTDKLFQSKDYSEFKQLYTNRYNELRQTALSEENIINTINEHYYTLYNSGAYQREFVRWDLDIDLQAEYDRLVNFMKNQLIATDEFIENLDYTYKK